MIFHYSGPIKWISRKLLWTSVLFLLAYLTRPLTYPLFLASIYHPKEVPLLHAQNIQLNDFLVLDARSRAEFQVSHLPQAQYIGYSDFSAARVQQIPRHKPILIYCSIGYRSQIIARKLQKLGFTQVYNLYGGIFEWLHQHRTLMHHNQPTNNLHTYNFLWSFWARQGTHHY